MQLLESNIGKREWDGEKNGADGEVIGCIRSEGQSEGERTKERKGGKEEVIGCREGQKRGEGRGREGGRGGGRNRT